MSAVRLCVARLAPLVALATLSLIAGCTKQTPLYCETVDGCDENHGYGPGFYCDMKIHTCKTGNTAVDANDAASTGDAAGDKPTDGGTGEDHPSGTGDASDGSPDVLHGCVDNRGCPDSTKHVCQVDAGVCVGCLQNGDCTTAGARACDTTANKCVECVVNADCTDPTKPVCEQKACRGCKADSECAGTGPGVCMFHLDGHCATDGETVYVAPNNSSCSDTDPASGTSRKPFCHSQAAIDSTAAPAPVDAGTDSDGGDSDAGAGTAKTLVIMQGGTSSLSAWSFNDASRTLTVVGQLSALLSPGGATGIHISGGKLYIRNLRVSGGSGMDPAIVVEGGAELHLDRCTVDNNHGAGVQIDNAGFEITNSVIAGNGVGTFSSGPVLWSGVLLGAVPAGKPAVFQNNTVVSNSEPGVICTTGNSHDVVGSILFGNMPTSSPQSVGCNFVSCCTGDPTLTSSYRLTATSPCRNQLTVSTTYDIDGDPRPFGTLSDCGADEYTGP